MPRQRQHKDRQPDALKLVRCAIYTRKSTDENLDKEFNSLDAQRDAGESFVASQRHEGWVALPDRYDDGGYTGANTDRPALRRLMQDIADGKVDMVVVYKIDRLSRSLLDFAGLMKTFEERGVGFTSVTQQFSTSTSMGRLILNVLLSFAQFEREVIAERTRDKIAATRRRGRWTGGQPLLGYDVDKERTKLVVNDVEAEQVRGIFALYLEQGSLLPTVQELARRGWTTKRWTTRDGQARGGHAFTRSSLHRLLTNVAYLGKTRYREEVHQGEHAAIVDEATFQRVQATLARNDATGGAACRDATGSWLRGLFKCGVCASAMTPTHTTRGERRYRYYRCSRSVLSGKAACTNAAVPAGQVEAVVLGRLRAVGSDPALRAEVLEQARKQAEARNRDLAEKERSLERDLTAWGKEVLKLSALLRPGEDNADAVGRLAELQQRIGQVEGRVRKVKQHLAEARHGLLDEERAGEALALFDPAWEAMSPREHARVAALLIDEVVYDAAKGKLTIHFAQGGLAALAEELTEGHDQRQRA